MAVKSELGDSGFDLWDRWSSYEDSPNEASAKAVWKSISRLAQSPLAILVPLRQAGRMDDDGATETHS